MHLKELLKGITATKKYSLYNHDTLLITIAIQPDRKVKIKSISAIGSPLIQVLNDKDYDGMIDSKDECPEDKGKMYLNGCPSGIMMALLINMMNVILIPDLLQMVVALPQPLRTGLYCQHGVRISME